MSSRIWLIVYSLITTLGLYFPEQDSRLYTARLEWIYFALHAASKIFKITILLTSAG